MRTDLVKVILYSYPQLSALAEASEVSACNRALLSYRDPRPCEETAMRVLEEKDFACGLRELEADVKEALSSLTETDRALIAHKYFRRGEAPKDSRSYYRHQLTLLKRVTRRMMYLGWSDERFFHVFGRYAPFMKLLRRIEACGDHGLFRNLRRPPSCAREARAQQSRLPPRR